MKILLGYSLYKNYKIEKEKKKVVNILDAPRLRQSRKMSFLEEPQVDSGFQEAYSLM